MAVKKPTRGKFVRGRERFVSAAVRSHRSAVIRWTYITFIARFHRPDMLINRHPALLVLARKIWYLNGGILAEEKKKRERKNGGRRKGDEKNEHEHEGKGKKKEKAEEGTK